ncbi:hypothetical protein MBLNU230_g7171t1 [Neophaeotheca triangularis]
MKTTFALAGLAACAAAVPFGADHRHLHKHAHEERDVHTNVVYATAAKVMVYVDQQGNPVSTTTMGVTQETQAPIEPKVKVAAQPEPTPEAAAPAYSPSEESSDSDNSGNSGSSGSSAGGIGSGHGIVYSPYAGDGTCKDQSQVNQDFAEINGYDTVRIYGVDCNQVTTVLSAAKSKNMGVFAGIFNIDQVSNEVQTLIDAVDGDWDMIKTVSVGNEGINNGDYSISAVSSAVDTARSALQSAGYNGPVVTVDTFVAIIANPGLCEVGDFVAANCHAYFDGGVEAKDAGDFVLNQAQRVSSACNGKTTVITETGWPSQGSANQKAVPSKENQAAAVQSIEEKFDSNVILFTAFNDHWKTDFAGSHNAEQYWGIYGDAPA